MLKGIRGGIAVTIRVFMVDDHALVRTGLRMILSAETDIEILGEAESGEEALPQIRKLLPGSESPTIIPLEGHPDKVAIHAVCRENVFWETLESLKQAGASALLVLPVEKMLA